MGIKNLLKFIQPVLKYGNIYEIWDANVGVDMHCFMYKSIYHYDPMKHILIYLKKIIRLAKHVYLVFDGHAPELKKQEQKSRIANMEKYSPDKSWKKIPEFKKEIEKMFEKNPKVSIIRSPEESDGQLAYLSSKNLIDVVITEDSDLIIYGVPKIIFKFKPSGRCEIYNKQKLEKFLPWDFKTFRWFCILSGCDYLRGGLRGFGLVRAQKMFQTSIKSEEALKQILKQKFKISNRFFRDFKNAHSAFQNPWIYDPETDTCRRLNSEIVF